MPRCEYLLQKAARPYFEMVSLWVYEGRLEDPFEEFAVRQRRDELRKQGPAADFWQKHFVLEDSKVPKFLQGCKEQMLHAGAPSSYHISICLF